MYQHFQNFIVNKNGGVTKLGGEHHHAESASNEAKDWLAKNSTNQQFQHVLTTEVIGVTQLKASPVEYTTLMPHPVLERIEDTPTEKVAA